MAEHIVKKGDHVPRLAHEGGHRAIEQVWDHPDNEELRKVREDPCILLAGDTLVVPETEKGSESGSTDAKHRFVAEVMRLTLGVKLQNWDGKELEPEKLLVKVDGSEVEPEDEGGGAFRTPIAPTAKEALVRADGREATLRIGHLDPIDSDTGVRARLQNLGYRIDDETDDAVRLGVEEFQVEHGLWVDGVVGPNTRGKLEEEHGC